MFLEILRCSKSGLGRSTSSWKCTEGLRSCCDGLAYNTWAHCHFGTLETEILVLHAADPLLNVYLIKINREGAIVWPPQRSILISFDLRALLPVRSAQHEVVVV